MVLFHSFYIFLLFFQAAFLSPWQALLYVAPFAVELGKDPKTLFLLSKALKARVGEQYYYGYCFHFLGGIYKFVFLHIWRGGK